MKAYDRDPAADGNPHATVTVTVTVTVNGRSTVCPVGTCLGDCLAMTGQGSRPCGGRGVCGRCRVTVMKQDSVAVTPPTEEERRHLTADKLAAGVRLACCTRVLGDCVVTTMAPSLGSEQICAEGALPASLDRLSPAFSDYGVAVDIGTTTLAARLYDASGRPVATVTRPNPQSVWGTDVLSRMEAACHGRAGALAGLIRRAVDGMLTELADAGAILPHQMDGVVLTGNTAMLYLLTETPVEALTHAPFAVERRFGETVTAAAVGLTVPAPHTEIYLPPVASAFVGADAVAATLAADLTRGSTTALLVDIGTNGEMVLWHEGNLYACSAAAGPAFEGAGISMGMSGRAGAIDRVWMEPAPDAGVASLGVHILGEGEAIGLCGSGLVDAVACLRRTGQLDETGYLRRDPTLIYPPVQITQEDIRAVQLAKSAIHAGMITLLRAAGITPADVDDFAIAGGFGRYLDPANAAFIGLFPAELCSRARVLGNAALAGAATLLLSRDRRAEAAAIAEQMQMMDLATSPIFAQAYMEGMRL